LPLDRAQIDPKAEGGASPASRRVSCGKPSRSSNFSAGVHPIVILRRLAQIASFEE